jgi:hypothetical protein
MGQIMESAADNTRAAGTRWARSLRTGRNVVSVALVAVGAWHVTEGSRALDALDVRHVVVGVALIALGLFGVLRHASRLRKPAPEARASGATQDPGLPLRIPQSKRATTRLLVAGGWMCALSVAVMVLPWLLAPAHGHAPHPLVLSSIGLAGLLFFGTCLFWIARRRLDGGDALVADRLGLCDRSNATGDEERVPWRDIGGFRVVAVLGQRFVAVDLLDPGKFVDRAHGWRRLARSANRRLTGSPWCITPAVLDWSAPDLAERLEAQRARQLASH